MKRTIGWVTENFVDVDLPIINQLSIDFNINWYITISEQGSKFYSAEKIKNNISKNVNVNLLECNGRLRSLNTINHYKRIAKALKKEKPDIYYFDCSIHRFLILFFFIVILLKKNKVIYAIHDTVEHSGRQNLMLLNVIKFLVYKYLINFQFFSHEQKRLFEKLYSKRKNLSVTKLCLKNFGKSTVINENLENEYSVKKILFFGSIRPNKGLKELIFSVNQLSSNDTRIQINVCGYTRNFGYYYDLIKNKNIFNVDIRLIPDEEVPNLFSSSHYVVLPYTDMTQSGILSVAYQYNIPVICSNLPEFINEVDDGNTGFIFDFKKPQQFPGFLDKICNLSFEEYLKVKSNQYEFVQLNYSIENITLEYKKYFDKIMI